MLKVQLNGGVAPPSNLAGFVGNPIQLGAPVAERAEDRGTLFCAGFLREQINRSPKSGEADIAGVARTSLHDRTADHGCREERGGMVGWIVGIAPGDSVKCNVVLIVAETPHDDLGLAQSGSIGRIAGETWGDHDNTAVFGGGSDGLLDELAGDYRLRLGRVQAGLGGRDCRSRVLLCAIRSAGCSDCYRGQSFQGKHRSRNGGASNCDRDRLGQRADFWEFGHELLVEGRKNCFRRSF